MWVAAGPALSRYPLLAPIGRTMGCLIRPFLIGAVLIVGGACSSAPAAVPETGLPRYDQTAEYQSERAVARDRDICLNPTRRCQDLSPADWDALRADWDRTHP